MKERPILFNAPMVRAILAGTKTQTRRALKPQPPADAEFHITDMALNMRGEQDGFGAFWLDGDREPCGDGSPTMCPYGAPGDLLWVREAHWWRKDERDPVSGYFPPMLAAEDVEYRADGEKSGRVWRPSIHMPRWASRITLEVVGVRVERLQDISEADALAEGVDMDEPITMPMAPNVSFVTVTLKPRSAREAYAALWEQINGPGSWGANPFVWAVEFRKGTT